ncbi:MAG: hypothetical protein KBI41_08590 [Kiritimatiellae bacterium]|jgi:hypothetical protein|nr:hypothetical protein [Kiritimatiellia bacterium]MDD2349350.1 hypothetical protein [Kiritimatiellia bacterium]HHU14068.1 hypothetical protein [Lentisphaerota bacterium]
MTQILEGHCSGFWNRQGAKNAKVFGRAWLGFFYPQITQMTQILEGHCSGLFNHEIHGIHEKAQHCFRVVRVVRGLDF